MLSGMSTVPGTLTAPTVHPPVADDQRVFFTDVTWTDFEVILAIRGDRAGIPSIDHEGIKTVMARLLEVYALERGIPLNGFGSWTLKNPLAARALEPDECYAVGTARPERPDLAIEVMWTAGGLDKLEVYRGLGVPEVWMWRQGVIEVHRLAGERYERRERSPLFPDLDLAELARHIDATNQTDAVRRYRDALRRRPPAAS
jgi:Uma2 family endonuclease